MFGVYSCSTWKYEAFLNSYHLYFGGQSNEDPMNEIKRKGKKQEKKKIGVVQYLRTVVKPSSRTV